LSFLSTAVQEVLEQAPFCAVASSTPRGPHCTPLVFAYSGGRVWLTTSRRSVKARAWKLDPSVAGLVRFGELSVTFTGTVHAYDALDRSTWGPAVASATSIARAGAGFSKKNAKFFAGYAFDARQVPFAWTPPGRVFVGIDLERTALLGEDGEELCVRRDTVALCRCGRSRTKPLCDGAHATARSRAPRTSPEPPG